MRAFGFFLIFLLSLFSFSLAVPGKPRAVVPSRRSSFTAAAPAVLALSTRRIRENVVRNVVLQINKVRYSRERDEAKQERRRLFYSRERADSFQSPSIPFPLFFPSPISSNKLDGLWNIVS